MALLKIYVKSLVKPEDGFNKALSYCIGRLGNYFNRCVAKTDKRLFNSAEVKLNPHSHMVGDMDLLVYIVANRKNTLMPTVPATPEAAGRTQPFPNGVLSEVFASRAMDDGKLFGLIGGLFANHPRQGIALANLAFHELAHNKSGQSHQSYWPFNSLVRY